MGDFTTGKRVCSWKLSPELDDLLALVARFEDRSKSAVVRRAVLGYLHAGNYLDSAKVPELAKVTFPDRE